MTYEELIVAVAKLAIDLKPAALKLLLHLIHTAIADGTNEIKTTAPALASQRVCSPDKTREAAAALQAYIGVTVSKKTGYTFRLPAEWFSQGRGIFTDWATVEKPPQNPGNQATRTLETRPPEPWKPGLSGRMDGEYQATRTLETRPLRRMDGEYQATGTLETRPLITQNQQVADQNSASNRIDRVLVNLEGFRSIEQIACAKVVPPELHADGVELSNAIRTYHRQYGPRNAPDKPVDEQIIARCLAVAPLGSLLSELKQMRMRDVRAGSGHGWYVSVFCQRLKGIPSNVLASCLEDLRKQGRHRQQTGLDFSTRMAGDVRQQMRRIS